MRKLIVVLLALTLVMSLVLACARPTTPTATPSPKPVASPTPSPSPKPTVSARPAADFYKNNLITMIIPFAPGGGTDRKGRLFASFLGEVTGGTTKVENLPGGGGIVGANTLFKSKPDGLTLMTATTGSGLIIPTLFADPAKQYKIEEFNYLGELWIEPNGFAIGAKLPHNSMVDLQKAKGLKFGGTQGTPAWGAAVVAELFGLDAKVVTGYQSGADVRLAVTKGELDGSSSGIATIQPEVDKGWMKPAFLVIARERDKAYPNTPAITELVKLTPEQDKLLELFIAMKGGDAILTAPGIPPDRLQFLRDAFSKTIALPAFLEQSKKLSPVFPKPLLHDELQAKMKRMAAIPKAEIDNFSKVMNKYLTK